jgi:hypothetical protein
LDAAGRGKIVWKRKIDAGPIMADIRSGMGDVPIMEKYQITPNEYLKIITKLPTVSSTAARQKREAAPVSVAIPQRADKRARPRGHLLYRVTVQDLKNLDYRGKLNDISEQGLQVCGIPMNQSQARSLLIRSDVYLREPPLVVEAACRWTYGIGEHSEPLAGLQITEISRKDLKVLKRMLLELAILGAR